MKKKETLKEMLQNKGIKLTKVAELLDISMPTLYNRLDDPSKFTAGNIKIICDTYGIDPDIFLA